VPGALADHSSAGSLPVSSNFTRCASCRRTSEIRVHYCPGCTDVIGDHFHRVCRCGATWLERSAGHAGVDISLDDPAFVAICPALPDPDPERENAEPGMLPDAGGQLLRHAGAV
jgi:hypothetical protein